MDTNGIDLGNAFDWLGKTEVPADTATTETTQTADDKAPLATEGAEEKQPETKVEAEAPKTEEKPADESPVLPQIVDDLGGEDAARQFIPLVRAIQEVAEETDENVIGTKLDDAIRGLLTPEQYSQFSFKLYDKYGAFFTEQFLQDNPNWLKEQGFVKASTQKVEADDDDLLDDDTDAESPQVKALQAQLAQQQAEINNLKTKTQTVEAEKAQQAEAQILDKAKTVMLGSVVDRVFEKMDWQTAEVQQAARLALANFQNDTEAVKAFRQGVEYQKTGQKLLQGSQVKASKAFERYLGEAIEFVDSKRVKAMDKKEPIPPARKEISSTTPSASNSQQQSQPNGQNGNNPFDPNMLMAAVQERLRANGGASRSN